MRLIGTFSQANQASLFASFLKDQGIESEVEISICADWGSDRFGQESASIWIKEENDGERAASWYREFLKNPEDPRFKKSQENILLKISKEPRKKNIPKAKHVPLTRFLLSTCIILFAINIFFTHDVKHYNPWIAEAMLTASPINRELLFDYPKRYEMLHKIANTYGIESLEDPEEAPPQEQKLLLEQNKIPIFQGFYPLILRDYQHPEQPFVIGAPLFEKIRQGELWRLFTPALLHIGFLHLFFNMSWLFVLGSQIERKLGFWKYLLFSILAAIFSNTGQYLMSGANFMGFSGVIFAFIVYVWFVQKREGAGILYLHYSTMRWVMMFLVTFILLQILSFFLEAHWETSIGIGMANTAHFVGAFTGYIFSKLKVFS